MFFSAQRDALSPTTAKKGWLGGWFGGKKDAGPAPPAVHKGKLGDKLSLYYDPETKKWVNPNATAEEKAASAAKATPPPPRAGPPMGMAPPTLPPSPAVGGESGPPTPLGMGMGGGPPAGVPLPPSAPGSAPPSRPPTGLGGANNLDDLLGGAGSRKAGGTTRAKKGKGSRYVDVMAKT